MADENLVTVRISREPAEQLRDIYSAAFGSGVNIRQTVERAITQEINRQLPDDGNNPPMRTHFDRNSEWYCNIDQLHPEANIVTSEDPNDVTCQRCLAQMERHPREGD